MKNKRRSAVGSRATTPKHKPLNMPYMPLLAMPVGGGSVFKNKNRSSKSSITPHRAKPAKQPIGAILPRNVNLPTTKGPLTKSANQPVKRQSNLSLREKPKNTCKQRPEPKRSSVGGRTSRPYVPWCDVRK